MILDSFTLTSKGAEDVFVLKLNAAGNTIWLKQIGSIASDIAGDICISNNKIYVTGAVNDTALFGQTVIPKKAVLTFLFQSLI